MPKLSENEWSRNKERIIDTAFGLFAEKGYTQVSVNDIVKAAAISKGGFYTYFISKQEIFLEILDRADKRKIGLAAELARYESAEEKMAAYLRRRLEQHEENKKWVKFAAEFWSTADRDDDVLREKDQARFERYTGEIRSIIEEGIGAGEFRPVDGSMVYIVTAMIDGMQFLSSVMERPFDDKKIETAIGMCIKYLKRQERNTE